MFFFLFIDIRVVSGEVDMYDSPGRTINNRDKVLRGKPTMSVVLKIELAVYQRVSVKVLVVREPSKA